MTAVGLPSLGLLWLFVALEVLPTAREVRRTTEPVVYLTDALGAQARALADVLLGVHRALILDFASRPAQVADMRRRVTALMEQAHLRGYEQVPRPIRAVLASADADITQAEDRLIEVLDLAELGRVGEARQRMLLADSLQQAVRKGLTVAQLRGTMVLVAQEGALERAARLGLWATGGVAVLVTVLGLTGLAIIARRIDAPLAELGGALQRARGGDLDVSLPVRRNDEMGQLAEHFNEMTRVMGAARRHDVEALRRSETSYRTLVRQARHGIFRATPSGRFLMVNPALAAMLGYETEDELLRIDLATDLFADPAARERVLCAEPRQAEVEWKRRDGKTVTVLLTCQGIVGSDGAVAYVEGIAEDVTDRLALEARLRQAMKMEAVGRLAGGVAHDFNNVLTAIIGQSELLLNGLQDDARRRHVEAIRAAATRAAALTRQLLAFSRKQVLQPRVVDLNSLIRAVDKMLRHLIGEDVELESYLEPELGAVLADPGQIEQVLLNLAVNARDAMPAGGRLTITTADVALDAADLPDHPGPFPARYVLLAVSDNGVGMDDATRSHLFEPFFTTKEQGKGTGLGLATVYGVVRQSSGFIRVTSAPGEGATFRIYLPRVGSRREEEAAASGRAPEGGSETVLLVEDEATVRDVLRDVLQAKGYRVLLAEDGQAALDALRLETGRLRLLITDMVMPGMSGRLLAETVRAKYGAVPVLYISGYTDDAILQAGLAEEGTACLQKPFTAEDLTRKVREVLDRGVPARSRATATPAALLP